MILGLHIGAKVETEYNRSDFSEHDSAAVLLHDADVIAAIEEERLSRVKHCNFFPKRAIDFCLRQGGISLDDVDFVAVSHSRFSIESKAIMSAFDDTRENVRSGDEFLLRPFWLFNQKSVSSRLIYCSHHLAHAWSAFPLSGFDESIVVVLDGNGAGEDGRMLSGLIGVAENGEFKVIREIDADNSLGNFYQLAIKFIGYDRFDEYKVMGLAPYGDPANFRKAFRNLYTLKQNGDYFISDNLGKRLWQGLLELGNFKLFRRADEPIEQVHKDFAAALQESLEEIVLHIIKGTQKELKKDYLCFAGGVAHNCTLNGKIKNSHLFKNIFIQPAAHDAGGALGAALYAQSLQGPKNYKKLSHLYYGTPIPKCDEIADELAKWGPVIKFCKSENICHETAKLIAQDAVVGWVQGRSEFGPRALGNRSILADPRPTKNKDRINMMIKKREGYRPFAPSVLAERACEFFQIQENASGMWFMNLVTSVREEKRERLGAITHVDGTARVQVVQRETNPKYWDLINEFGKITDIPILLNTSFNNNVEPIVDSVGDAVTCFLTTELTHLIIDSYIIYKKEPVRNCLPDFRIGIKESYKLVSGFKPCNGGFSKIYSIEFNDSRYFAHISTEVSKNVFRILSHAQDEKVVDIARQLEINLDDGLIDELFSLWSKRVIWLKAAVTIRN